MQICRPLNVIIDAGHFRYTHTNGTRVYVDKGANYRANNGAIIFESDIAYDFSLTLKWLLINEGAKAVITRDNTTPATYRSRTSRHGDLFISIHADCVGCHAPIYYASEEERPYSHQLAELIAHKIGDRHAIPSQLSRFGRLYIDDTVCTDSILVEVGAIDKVENSRQARIDFCNKIVDSIRETYQI